MSDDYSLNDCGESHDQLAAEAVHEYIASGGERREGLTIDVLAEYAAERNRLRDRYASGRGGGTMALAHMFDTYGAKLARLFPNLTPDQWEALAELSLNRCGQLRMDGLKR